MLGGIGVRMLVLFSDCDPSQANDKGLPTNAYLIEYIQDEVTHFDIMMSSKKSDIFDHYYDKYKKDLINITQTEGRVRPNLYGESKKKKGK